MKHREVPLRNHFTEAEMWGAHDKARSWVLFRSKEGFARLIYIIQISLNIQCICLASLEKAHHKFVPPPPPPPPPSPPKLEVHIGCRGVEVCEAIN